MMESQIVFDPNLTKLDFLVLENLTADVKEHSSNGIGIGNGETSGNDNRFPSFESIN